METFQDPARYVGLRDRRQDPHPATACGATQRIDLEDPLQEIGPGRATGRGPSGSDERRESSSCVRRYWAGIDRSRPMNCGSGQRNDVGENPGHVPRSRGAGERRRGRNWTSPGAAEVPDLIAAEVNFQHTARITLDIEFVTDLRLAAKLEACGHDGLDSPGRWHLIHGNFVNRKKKSANGRSNRRSSFLTSEARRTRDRSEAFINRLLATRTALHVADFRDLGDPSVVESAAVVD